MPFVLLMLQRMQLKYRFLNAANHLHKKVDSEPSPEPEAVNVTVSFDSSWKTWGFYSNIGFRTAISELARCVEKARFRQLGTELARCVEKARFRH